MERNPMQEIDLMWMFALLITPLVFGFICLGLEKRGGEWTYWLAGIGGAITLGLALGIISLFKFDTVDQFGVLDDDSVRIQTSLLDRGKMSELSPDSNIKSSFDWIGKIRWIPRLGIDFHVGLDGASLSLIVMTALIFFFGLLACWRNGEYSGRLLALLLFGESMVIGALLSLNWVLWLVFLSGAGIVSFMVLQGWAKGNRESILKKYLSSTVAAGLILAALGFYCRQLDLKAFANPNEIKAAENQLKRAHPDWTDSQIHRYLNWNTYNLLALQRAGMAAVENKIPGAEAASPLANSTVQSLGFLAVLIGGLLMTGLLPPGNWLSPVLQDSSPGVSLSLGASFSALALSGILKFGVNIFPLGLLQLAPVITWASLVALLLVNFRILGLCRNFSMSPWVGLWTWLVFLLALSGAFQGEINSWKSKTFSGGLFWFLCAQVAFAGLVMAIHLARKSVLVDSLDSQVGLGKAAPGVMAAIGFFSLAVCGFPLLGGFTGLAMFVPGIFQLGIFPGGVLSLSFLLLTYGLFRFAWQFLGDIPVIPAKQMQLGEMILVTSMGVILLMTGVFPNLVLSWMQPSVAAIPEIILTHSKF
ncbi:MAG: hypothetical protein EXR99_16025 [Gemmataceae bacterium]|nr:hypothetical protein [Gemmataceae bacterium]